jgi:hypothetical protein
MGTWRQLLVLSCGIATLLLLCPPASAQPTDMAVKAAFLPRFARYVTWPAAAMPKGSDPFVLCVIGRDPFGALLDDAARTQLIDGRRILVRRLDSGASADGCQIAFLASGGSSSPPMPAKPVLTVTDAANGATRGIIHFVVTSGRVRFFIDQRSAQQRGLSISSRLLALAVGVRQ